MLKTTLEMSKDSYWFKHDSTAGRALKMRKMSHIYGHEGKGLYWDVVEILRDQEGYRFESDESSLQMLCDLVGYSDDNRFISWFKDSLRLGLFEIRDEYFFCPPLSKNMENWEIKKSNGSKGGRPKKTETKTEIKPNDKPNQNHKRREEKIREEKRTSYSFSDFWDLYDKKTDRVKVEKKWDRLSEKVRREIMEVLAAYIKSTPDKKYRKNPLTWLNGNCWKDEVEQKSFPKIDLISQMSR